MWGKRIATEQQKNATVLIWIITLQQNSLFNNLK